MRVRGKAWGSDVHTKKLERFPEAFIMLSAILIMAQPNPTRI